MNKARRKDIDKAIELLTEARDLLSACADEEREYHDNMPENMQQGEKGERADAAADALQEAADEIDNIVERAQEAQE